MHTYVTRYDDVRYYMLVTQLSCHRAAVTVCHKQEQKVLAANAGVVRRDKILALLRSLGRSFRLPSAKYRNSIRG